VRWMEVPYDEELATHVGRESCAGSRKGLGEALTAGVRAEHRAVKYLPVSGAQAVLEARRQHRQVRYREDLLDPARSKTSSTYASTPRGNREALRSALRDGSRVRVANPQGARQR
jgi:hypothetical protein